MSKETLEWLNTNTLIGFTDKRGHAWHYKEGADNHYPQAVPMDDVLKRLFHWEAVELPVQVVIPAQVTADGVTPEQVKVLTDRKAIARNDTFDVMGLFKQSYHPHQYKEWLLETVGTILDDTLSIGSAGLLRGGAQAWVSVEVPDNIVTPEGVEFRPNLIACTSFDGSLATTFKRTVTAVVCDNTLAAGLSEDGQKYKVKHSKYSAAKIADAREALAIVHTMADDFAAEVSRLTSWKVSDNDWQTFLKATLPTTEGERQEFVNVHGIKKELTNRIAVNHSEKRAQLQTLYMHDERAASWRGSAYGVLAAVNTWNHHYAGTRGNTIRAERNMSDVLTDKFAKADDDALKVLAAIA